MDCTVNSHNMTSEINCKLKIIAEGRLILGAQFFNFCAKSSLFALAARGVAGKRRIYTQTHILLFVNDEHVFFERDFDRKFQINAGFPPCGRFSTPIDALHGGTSIMNGNCRFGCPVPERSSFIRKSYS